MRHPIVFNIWRQRIFGKTWVWVFTVGYEYDEEALASGWKMTREEAEAVVMRYMADAEKTKQPWE